MRRVVTIVGVLSAVLLFAPAAAFAQSATTGSANPIGTSSTTVSAVVNPQGDTVDPNATDDGCYFEYGTTTAYGTNVECNSIPSGSSDTTVSADLTGLTPGQGYDYQVVLVTESDCILSICLGSTDTDGGNQTFTTGTGTPTVTAPSSSSVTASSASVAADVNPQGVTITGCNVYYGPSVTAPTAFHFTGSSGCSGTPTSTNPGPAAITANLSGLTSFTQYEYVVVLTYGASSVDSSAEDFTTLSVGVASTGSAESITADSATLTGTFQNPQGVTITGCEFIYGTGSPQPTQPCAQSLSSIQAATTSPITLSADLAGLAPSTNIPYALVVTTANGAAAGGATSFDTDAAPSADSEAASSVTYQSATLNGVVNGEGAVVNSCEFNLTVASQVGTGGGGAGGNTTQTACSPAASTLTGTSPVNVTADLNNLPADTQYSYTVELDTALGDFVGAAETFTTPVLPSPSAVTGAASKLGSTTAHLSAVVDAAGQAVGNCEFEFGIIDLTSVKSPGTDVSCTPTPSNQQTTVGVNLKGLAPGTTYYYRVLFSTAIGPVIGVTRSFRTSSPGSKRVPVARITRSAISTSGHSARFYWTHSGGSPSYVACAIAKVKNGKAASHTFSNCSSGKRYTKLGKGTWKFFLRMSNNTGESQATAQFKI
jgi:phosphodiesterase/alkaline phosphatase D-like protein